MQVKASVWTQRERPAAAWVQGRTVLALGVLLGWAVQSARLGPESTAVKPAARPGQAHLPTRGQRPADARLGRCWTSVVSSQRPGVARVPGGGGGVLVGRSGSRGQKPAWLESAERPERPGARGGVYAHGTRTRPHPAAPGARPQETVHPLPVYPSTRLPATSHGVFCLWQGHRSDVLRLITSSSGVGDF